jgi:hypothetical protein
LVTSENGVVEALAPHLPECDGFSIVPMGPLEVPDHGVDHPPRAAVIDFMIGEEAAIGICRTLRRTFGTDVVIISLDAMRGLPDGQPAVHDAFKRPCDYEQLATRLRTFLGMQKPPPSPPKAPPAPRVRKPPTPREPQERLSPPLPPIKFEKFAGYLTPLPPDRRQRPSPIIEQILNRGSLGQKEMRQIVFHLFEIRVPRSQFCELIGYADHTFDLFLSGNRQVTPTILAGIRWAFGLTPTELLEDPVKGGAE